MFVEAEAGLVAHGPGEACGDVARGGFAAVAEGEGGGVRGNTVAVVGVEARAGFPAAVTCRDEFFQKAGHAHAVGESVGQGAGDVDGDIEADLVQQAQRAHRHAEIEQGVVNGRGIAAAFEELRRLDQIGHEDAVDEKTGRIADDDRKLANGADEGDGGGEGFAGGHVGANHLDELHAVDGIEKVETDEALGIGDDSRQLVDRKGGGIRGEDGVGAGAGGKVGEDFQFDIEAFDGGLDD